MLRIIGMLAKCPSWVRITEPVSRAPAAIQTSSVGIGVPCAVRYFTIVTTQDAVSALTSRTSTKGWIVPGDLELEYSYDRKTTDAAREVARGAAYLRTLFKEVRA